MKIGILTLPPHTNYGGILQAYALQTVLKRMGHEVIVIDKSPYKFLKTHKKPLSYTKRFIKKYLFRQNIRILSEEHHNKIHKIISQYVQPFIDKNINRIEVDDLSILKEKDFDAIVVGSDQIWRPIYYTKIENAYLDFTKTWDIKKISYAASFGTDIWEYSDKQTKKCGELLKKFTAISVREDSAVELCNKYFGVRAEHVLDPTMLLDAEDYIQIIKEANLPKSKGTLLFYILDETEDKKRIIDKISRRKGLIPFCVNSRIENHSAPVEERIQPPMKEWLRSFYDAEFVVTDSFHGTVFSIIFNKPFIAISNESRGQSRFLSLLRMFKLEGRLIFKIDDLSDDLVNASINYTAVNEIGKGKQKMSLKYLESALAN